MGLDSIDLDKLEKDDDLIVKAAIEQFISQNANSFVFPNITSTGKKRLGQILAEKLATPGAVVLHAPALELLRIIARDKKDLEELVSDDLLDILAYHAKLKETHVAFPSDEDLLVTSEAQKVLCNVVFNSTSAQRYFSRINIVDVLMSRISANKEHSKWQRENQLTDMKLLFILTILCADTRGHLRNECHAVQDLCIYATCSGRKRDHSLASSILCEILKILFNLVHSISPSSLTLGEEMDFVNIGQTCRELLITEQTDEVKKHVINLLTVVRKFGYSQLIVPIADDTAGVIPFEGFDVQPVDVMLKYLDDKISPTATKISDESLAPIMCSLTEASKALPIVRKFLRLRVLPPLRDVHTRPELGASLRAKLCRLLTSPQISVRDTAGDLLYVLCKNDVQRMVKYTGYGNAAGWLADHHLMGLPRSQENAEDVSDLSESEEYDAHRAHIDPMTGAVRVEGPDPMAGMSDEQKEHLCMELVDKLHKLTNMDSAFKPAAVGADGTVRTVNNIMEFREQILKESAPKTGEENDDNA